MTIDLTTSFLGLPLRSPLVVSSSPRSEYVRNIERMADAGAAAVVFHSLYEEQFSGDAAAHHFRVTPSTYCERIAKAKGLVKIPIIASVNAMAGGEWIADVKMLETAGADAIELNIFNPPQSLERSSADIEAGHVELVERLVQAVGVPVAVKVSPFYTNLFGLASRLVAAGARGLTLFSRFSQIELGAGEGFPELPLSTPMEMRLPMHWLAVMSGRLATSFAATGGIQSAGDVARMIMAGADVTTVCSVLLRRGIAYLETLEEDLKSWLQDRGYARISQLRGLTAYPVTEEPARLERASYIRALTGSEHNLNSLAISS